MVFQPKLKRPGNNKTTVIRVPIVYKELILELMETLDNRFDSEMGTHLLRKYINNLK
jgi:hypothetical protein